MTVRYHINYQKVVLVLAGENKKIDRYAIEYLHNFMKRKHANSAYIFCRKGNKNRIKKYVNNSDFAISIFEIDDDELDLLYTFYCFAKFFDNIVFTYTDIPKDNKLGTYLMQTDVSEKDAVCLALYHLRCIPVMNS